MIPVAKGRPKVAVRNGKAHGYTPAKTRKAEKSIADQIEEQGLKPIDENVPIMLNITFFLPRPTTGKAKKRLYPTVKPDLDNLEKLLLDGCSAWFRDQQVVDVRKSKRYAENGSEPRIVMEVNTIEWPAQLSLNRQLREEQKKRECQ